MRYQITSYNLLRQMLDDIPEGDSCLEWPRSRLEFGYGRVYVPDVGRVVYAHILAYGLKVRPIPPGLKVLHKCDNPPCFRPNHLFTGTMKDNMQDCLAKGRLRRGDKRGMNNGRAKLTDADVLDIRDLCARGHKVRDLAPLFSVSFSTIARAANSGWRNL